MSRGVVGVHALLARLLPAHAGCAVVAIDDDETLHADEAAYVADAVAARRREFAAGRRAARAALRALGVAAAGPLLPDADRVPRWPASVVGSITHTQHLAAAVVLPTTSAVSPAQTAPVGVGVDLEDAIALPDELWPLVLTPAERAGRLHADAAATALSPALVARLHFCAKESLYKCVFPVVRRPFDFTDVDLTFRAGDGAFVAHVHKAGVAPDRVLRGRWGRAGDHFVATTIWPSA